MYRRLLAAMLRPKQVSRIAQGCANLGCLDHAETTQSRSLELLVGQSSWTGIQYSHIYIYRNVKGLGSSHRLGSFVWRTWIHQKLAYEALAFTIPWQRQHLELRYDNTFNFGQAALPRLCLNNSTCCLWLSKNLLRCLGSHNCESKWPYKWI